MVMVPVANTPSPATSPPAATTATPNATHAPADFPVPGQPLLTGPADGGDSEDKHGGDDGDRYGPGPAPYRLWASGEYLLYWVKSGKLPAPLVSSGAPPSTGILGQPGTTVLFGTDLDYSTHSGGRLNVGGWLDEGGHVGVETTLFMLEGRRTGLTAGSDATGAPLLGLPVVNALTGQEAVSLAAFPGALAGTIVLNSSEQFYGGEANLLGSLFRSQWFVADMLVGFRYVGLDEDVSVASATTVLPGGLAAFLGKPVTAPNSLAISDRFETRNDFYGGQIGAHTQFRWNRLFVDFEGKLAVGNAHEVVKVFGSTTMASAGGMTTVPGGILAVATNSGLQSHDEFTFIPEGSVKVGVNITDYFTAFVSYTYLYWFDVARPGDQIDRVVNPNLVPSNLSFGAGSGPLRPAASGVQRVDFWAQGIGFGLELRY
jgi:hypothetical protein